MMQLFFTSSTALKVNSYYTLAISYCTPCVGKHAILGVAALMRRKAKNLICRALGSVERWKLRCWRYWEWL